MSSVDLNIIERGLKGQEWTAEKGPITAGDLAKISEQRTNNSSALNALPTPFARFFVVKEAFRRTLEEVKDPRKMLEMLITALCQILSTFLNFSTI